MTENDKKYWYDYTNYPKIYKECYWENFSSMIGKDGVVVDEPNSQIVKNRNEFIIKYNITGQGEIPRLIELNFLGRNIIDYNIDHIECYKTRDDKIIIISSPYMIKDNNKNYDNYIKKGWEEIPKLYDNSTITFLISFYLK
jgi:hypothetical protein